ncbi:MAG: hypothetical protein ILP16_00185 [Spirochaetales bacterium]|nr:hypothetical protein [Spirochaetales bacterium]
MRRAAAAAILLLLSVSMLFAYDPRLSAMGRIGVGVSGTEMQSYGNPAAVFFDDNSYTFSVSGTLGDVVGLANWPCYPSSSLEALFVANMITAGMDITYQSENRRESDHVDLKQSVTLDVNFSAGYNFISAGVGVTGGSQQQRLDVPMATLTDFPVQSVFAPFDRVVNSEFIQLRAGVMMHFGQFFVGVLLDNLLHKDGSSTTLKWSEVFDGTGVGAYWSRPEYSSRGRMNNIVVSAGAEVKNIFNQDERTFNTGAELKFRMVRDSSFFFRTGYSALWDDFLAGTVTAGLGVNLRRVELSGNIDVPIGGYSVVRMTARVLF